MHVGGTQKRWALVFVLIVVTSFVAGARPVGVSIQGAAIRVETGELRVMFRSTNGSVESVVHTRSGIELLSRRAGAWESLWGLEVQTAGGTATMIQPSQARSFSSRISRDRHSVDLVWSKVSLPNGVPLDRAEFVARVSVRDGSPEIYFDFEYSGLGAVRVTSVRYPSFFGVGELGASGDDDILLYPSFEGVEFRNPVKNLGIWWYTYPSAYASMQLVAFFDAKAGFYLAAEDPAGSVKDIVWSDGRKETGDKNLSFIHKLNGTEPGTFRLPYSIVLGATQGDWFAPAERYKRWASAQRWVTQAAKKHSPSWLSKRGAMFTFNAHATSGWPVLNQSYRDFLSAIQVNRSFVQSPMVAMLWGWEKYGAWVYGDYFPPREGWEAFDEMTREVHKGGDRLFTYVGPHFLDTSTDLYRSGTYAGSQVLDESGAPKSPLHAESSLEWAWMDIASAPWREKIVRDVETLAEHGVDAVQLDGFPACDPVGCSDTSHGHPPLVGGTWTTDSWIALLSKLDDSVLSRFPELVLSGEWGAEPYLPYLQLNDSTAVDIERARKTPNGSQASPVPLYEFVYHPYQLFFGKMSGQFYRVDDGSYLRLCIARMLLWGQILDYQYGSLRFDDPAADTTAADYLKRAVAARTGFASRYLVDGDMLPAPEVSSDTVTVSFHHWADGVRWSGDFAAVQHSAWRAATGSVGIPLTNISEQPRAAELHLDFARLGLEPKRAYRVTEQDGQVERRIAESAHDGFSASLSLEPGAILLVELD